MGIGSGWFMVLGALTRSTGWRRQRLGLCSSGRRTLSLEMRPSSDVVDPIVMKFVVALISLVRGWAELGPGAARLVRLVKVTTQKSFTGGNKGHDAIVDGLSSPQIDR